MARAGNIENLPEIDRIIAAVIIITNDNGIVMGRKDPEGGGVYPDAWHIPGGGVKEGETLREAALREAHEEVKGLDTDSATITQLEVKGGGETVKTLKDGTRVWCKMHFNHFEIRVPMTATELKEQIKPGDDLVELQIFMPDELKDVQQIPGGKEIFMKMGYVPAE